MKGCVYNPPFRMIYHAVFYPTLFENPPKGRIITFILHILKFLGRITILPIGGYLHKFTFYRVMPNWIPSHCWEVISINTIRELLESKGYNAILVVVDRLSKR